MSNLKFYIFLNIFNIIILMLILAGMYTVFKLAALLVDGPMLYFYCLATIFLLYIIYKLLLPKIFVKIARKYKNSIIGEFALTLKNKSKQKWKILLLAFCYDIPFILYWIDYDNLGTLVYALIAYLIFYAGGVFLFYIMLYREIKIKEGKIKPFF